MTGNAAIGLYRAGDLTGAEVLVSMLSSRETRQRATAAWCRGQTADPRFLPVISRSITEKDPAVRQHIFRALSEIRQKIRTTRASGSVKLLATRVETVKGANDIRRIELHASRSEQAVTGLTPIQFVLEDSGVSLARIDGQPRRLPDHLVAGFALPRVTDREDSMSTAVTNSLKAFLRHKKKLDRWAATVYAPHPRHRTQACISNPCCSRAAVGVPPWPPSSRRRPKLRGGRHLA